MVSGVVMIWKEGHVWMPQSWKQGQVRLIPNKNKPQTIGDARPITLFNADYKIYSHMLAWWLRLNDHIVFGFTINYEGFCQRTSWQHAIHTVSKERGGDYRAMAPSQGVLNEG